MHCVRWGLALLAAQGVFAASWTDTARGLMGMVWPGTTPSLLDALRAEEKVISSVMEWGKAPSFKGWAKDAVEMFDGVRYQALKLPTFPEYQLRVNVAEGEQFCDPDVKQISGYLDIGKTKHLWFVLYESRSKPDTDPLLMWLNGGPGCSSSTGMLFELGPCNVTEKGQGTRYNAWSWNTQANLLFLDQPINVGYSYADGDELVDTSEASAADVYAFLQLFMTRFPQYASLDFHVAAESYGGEYAPHIGSEIFKQNKALAERRVDAKASNTANPAVHINLASLMIGNGLSDPQTQFASIPEFACSPNNKFHVFEEGSPECQNLENKAGMCQKLMAQCDRFDSKLVCVPAALFCWGSLYAPVQDLGLNLYDLRLKCDREKDGDLCYSQMDYIDALMNKPHVKSQLGVPSSVTFQSCNMDVNKAFMMQGDSMVNAAALLPDLLSAGIRVLIYAGEADFMCNAIGNHDWVVNFPNPFHAEIANATRHAMYLHSSTGAKPKSTGWTIQAGQGAGNLTYAWVYEAGHMVPHDQPQVALAMVNNWLHDKQLSEK